MFEGPLHRRLIPAATAKPGSARRAGGRPCGGAINSPHLLQISGIGPADHLQSIGMPVVHDLPGVGANLQDHYVARVSHRVQARSLSTNWRAVSRLTREIARFFSKAAAH